MKTFFSPFILIQSIIDEMIIHPNIKESINITLKRYQLYHSNISQIIEQFFIENSTELNEKDDELCYVDSIIQEAYEDKLYFDDDQIFNNVNS